MIAPSTNDSRQPTFTGKIAVLSITHREQRSTDTTQPVAAVDRNVHPPATARGDQLVDRGVDRAVLAADPHSGQEAAAKNHPGENVSAVSTVPRR